MLWVSLLSGWQAFSAPCSLSYAVAGVPVPDLSASQRQSRSFGRISVT